MYRTKKDVDKYVESLSSKLSTKEFNNRAYSVARLYFEVGDYASCQKYVDQYLTQKDNNAAAHKLLGHALHKLGQKEKALEQYKTSLDLDPAQTSLILDICELLADNDVVIDVGRAKYWCEKAEAIFPRHSITFRLREKLISLTNPDPEALIKLLTSELTLRPKDALLHSRLLKHYLETNNIKEAFKHTCDVEFGENPFINNHVWYETVSKILRHNSNDFTSWCYQMLLLTVKERLCVLSLSEVPNGTSKSLVECNEFLHEYDQAIGSVVKIGACPGFAEFHSNLIIHHKGQFAFHAATFILKKAKKDQLSWRDATRVASPLMIVACQTAPIDPKANWLANAPESQKKAVHRWHLEGSYRCSQSGHYLLTNYQDKSQYFLDQISQSCADTHWKDKLYEKLFMNRDNLMKNKTSFFISTSFDTPALQLPRVSEIEVYDSEAQKLHANSLHHFVWMLMNYKNYADFKLTLFNMLMNKGKNLANCGPETLDKLDVFAFLICATFTSKQLISKKTADISDYKPVILPADITELLCHLSQIKWWDCAYKFSQNELGSELTDIRVTLSRGIEVVRCIDNHGLDPELLCFLGRVFCEQAKHTSVLHEKSSLELRACLYYSSAIPLLEKIKNKIVVKLPEKRMFDYTHKELTTKNLKSLLGESKLFIAVNYLNEGEYEKAIDMLSCLKSPNAYYHLSDTYKKMALEENFSKDNFDEESKSKYATLLLKAKKFAYKALESIKDAGLNKNQPLYSDIQELIEDLEAHIHRIQPDSSENMNNYDGRYSSDDNISYAGREHAPQRINSNIFSNMSSTPKVSKANVTNYRTAIDSQILENPRDDQFLERIENQIKMLQKRDNTIDTFMEQTKDWFEENRKLGSQIINTIQSNMQQTTDQFKLLKISVDQVKDQIDECRNECKDVGELKKQVAELKKEVNKLKKTTSEQTNENEIYNLQDDFRSNENTSSFAAQLPYTQSHVSQFNQRLVPPFPVPPNPYQFYGQNFYNLYNQYSQLFQPSTLPGAQPLFDANRPQVNYPGVFPTSDPMHLDVAHLAPPAATTIPVASKLATMSKPPPSISVNTAKSLSTEKSKDNSRSLPVNVVITSSDPLPTCTTAPAPILSVTIPPQHIKGTPHNYQIQMPSTTDTKVIPPPLFSFPTPGSKIEPTVTGSTVNWNRATEFQSPTYSLGTNVLTTSFGDSLDKNVADGIIVSSPNTSLNKSRTLSEKSNTSIENYDPCPDFKPIIPLPDEVKVTTGEEDEAVIFSSRAQLYRFIDKQWKERGLGEIKLLKHNVTGKVRVLMRRERVHKICANHIITAEMEIKPMKNETKAYFWVANDFADETVVLEKFCIRFKTADIATQFYKSFEKARQESMPSNIRLTTEKDSKPSVFSSSSISKEGSITSTATHAVKPEKTVIGGFTFSSIPAFKTTTESAKKESDKSTEPTTAKVNIFSNLTLKSSTDSPFSKIFSTPGACTTETARPSRLEDVTQKLNNSDTVEEFEPTAEFKPVVPLPALVDHKTGEEDEIVLFEHRAKLLRFEAPAKEWKERGLGNIKLLVNKDNNQKLRLLMRREQVMKVCCNHAITKEMTFQKMPNLENAVTWCAQDFSEGELIPETFCLRFKTVAACTDFIEAVKTAQLKMTDDSKAAKEEQNAAKQGGQVSFGEKFKPKPGSWCCEMCYTNNLENFLKCACCENPKPQIEKSGAEHTATNSWGDKFKPKPGSWECKDCLVRNDNDVKYCSACGSPKDPSISKKETKNLSENLPKFSFGIPAQTSSNIQNSRENIVSKVVSGPTVSGWGDKFKPKEGSWECSQCFVRNESNVEQCSACNNSKILNSVPQEKKSIFENEKSKNENTSTNSWADKFKPKPGSWECKDCLVRNENNVESCSACGSSKNPSISKKETKKLSDNLPKFSFGIPAQISSSIQKNGENVSIVVSGPTVSGWGDKFKPKEGSWECSQCFVRNESDAEQCSACNNSKDPNSVPKEKKSIFDNISSGTKFSFGIPSINDSQKPIQSNASSIFDGTGVHKFSFGVTTLDNTQQSKETVTPQKPALLPTPQKDPLTTTFSGKGGTFDFVFKPKTPPKGKSPMKSPKSEKGNDSDDVNEYASEDEGHHIHFSPIIPLPDKVEVVTGEENEDEIYGHRAKLFRFMSGEWKERGIGVVKILRHKDTGKLRVVMRREQVLKICLNHCLTPEIIYTPKDDKTWLFAANDFSEGELSLQQFCLRFKTKEIALEFKNYIDKARDGKTVVKTTTDDKLEDIDDVVFVKEIQATDEEKKKAKELLLPENFFTYQNKEPCLGCRGCKDDKEDNNCTTKTSEAITTSQTETNAVSTPVKNLTSFFQSPTNSIYGTPANFNRSADTSVFRTPFESLSSNSKSTSQTSSNLFNTSSEKTETNKENTLIQSPSIFTSTSEQNSAVGTQVNTSPNLSSDKFKTPVSSKNYILAAPKLSNVNSNIAVEKPDTKSVFGLQGKSLFGENKPAFGVSNIGTSINKSIFGFAADTVNPQQLNVKSLFGGDNDHKPVNLFSGSQQGSMFGPGALQDDQPKTDSNEISSVLSSTNSASGNEHQPKWSFQINKPNDETAATKDDNLQKDTEPTEKESLFQVDSSLTFASLSSSEPGFAVQKKHDFRWEGAGQQLFTSAQKALDLSSKSKNDSGTADESEAAGGGDEEYDPHYEPIVPLPDKIVVTTGEEDEQKLFGERCKLYRYDEQAREWKERGVGEMKVLYHPEKKSYRLLLRREQIHKAVLNMLLFADLELLPMKNSDRAWTWACRNHAESAAGEQETLAVRFKSVELATAFRDKVVECVRKLQAAAAQAIREVKESKQDPVAPLRLPKHLAGSARVDARDVERPPAPAPASASVATLAGAGAGAGAGASAPPATVTELFKQVHFQEPQDEEGGHDYAHDDDDYEHEYGEQDEYDAYYNDDEDESSVYYTCDGAVSVLAGGSTSTCPEARVRVMFDQDICSPKIMVTDNNTGEILADMLVYTETQFEISENTCSWSGTDYTTNDPVQKTVTVHFADSEVAMRFYDSCETSKAAAYSYADPES